MSLRDFNEPSRPLNNDAAGNGTGLSSFHTTHPETRVPSHMPQIAGAAIVALMVGAAAVGLYAYSGSSHPKPVAADINLAQPPAPSPATLARNAAANASTPADTTVPTASGM